MTKDVLNWVLAIMQKFWLKNCLPIYIFNIPGNKKMQVKVKLRFYLIPVRMRFREN
jgi:hypothetical protein